MIAIKCATIILAACLYLEHSQATFMTMTAKENSALLKFNPEEAYSLPKPNMLLTEQRHECQKFWRNGLPEQLKQKIDGNLQFTGTDAHASTMARLAEQWASKEYVEKVYLNVQLHTVLNIHCQNEYAYLRPDLLISLNSGQFAMIEVISKSETLEDQWTKILNICNVYPDYFDSSLCDVIWPMIDQKFTPKRPNMLRKSSRVHNLRLDNRF
jgi:hypothetical protein